ncbi:hypothetical protein GBAG_3074 [Buttiauxella agrestis ATCC 33320]|uniref:Uncharacterized protein n=1 Tax=Buttiauxella agrestis ATCC 33320 TaxID=1006004 RepID=A0A085G7V1_9ENTR|nr:hypothetical protein GBAG_3074 [Buttiauxella agrestis ATCC 33320]
MKILHCGISRKGKDYFCNAFTPRSVSKWKPDHALKGYMLPSESFVFKTIR